MLSRLWCVRHNAEVQDDNFHVEWSYDPVTLRPIFAAAGNARIVRIFDFWKQELIRVLRGHGHDILSLKFHPNRPHILATASGDKTIRIWNLQGADLEPPSDNSVNENFPQGDADEGTVALGILAGERPGGHRSTVSCLVSHTAPNLARAST